MRANIVIDGIQGEKDLRSVLMAHRARVLSPAEPAFAPRSIEMTDSMDFNGAALVCIDGTGYKVKSVPLGIRDAEMMLDGIAVQEGD